MRSVPSGSDAHAWVELLGVTTRRAAARQHLLGLGARAVPALRRGMHHEDPAVRLACAGLLDRLADDDSIEDLVAALDDPDVAVVRRALHALACDACKEGACRPGEELFVPKALELLRDPDADVRAGAIDTLGKVIGRRPDVAAALADVAEHDPVRGMREMARARLAGRA
jgi:HEAT repeat protein